LADRGLIGLEPGHWIGTIMVERTWVPASCQVTDAGHKMTGMLRVGG
jgi:hypothetical protein